VSDPYRVHVVDAVAGLDGLLAPDRTLRSEHRLRDEAQGAAARLIRDGAARGAEVRQRVLLLDSYVRRGERTPAHIYELKTRGGAS
jgi:hypothetical protein